MRLRQDFSGLVAKFFAKYLTVYIKNDKIVSKLIIRCDRERIICEYQKNKRRKRNDRQRTVRKKRNIRPYA